jgi:ABC-type branched-subunit amino acid transport system permease subunit
MNEWTNARLCDVANLVLGVILLISPWLFGFASGRPTQNAVITGIVIAAVSIAALFAFAFWEEWLNLALGLWTIISPWTLGFENTSAMPVYVVIGVLVAALAALEMWMTSQGQRPTHVG